MNPQPAITSTAALISDPARAAMLMMLVDGRARPAGELAYTAGVSPQTASSHLTKLLEGGLLCVEKEGRHRYYRLAGPDVVSLLKHLALFGPGEPVRRKAPNREVEHLHFARCCYDHLAGRLGVEMTKAMLGRGYLEHGDGKAFAVTPDGAEWFAHLGLDIARITPGRHGIARKCLDWTAREHHLAGPLGTQFMAQACTLGWFQRPPSTRAIEVTPKGWRALKRYLGLDRRSIDQRSDAG
ncbi:transcriptional regulator, ArsR family [Rhizobium freirei PRF 81]|uniref:Transcriptional regulator, ArsR family n=1 Tax=Rhizobium freirei PRF 81 TaxID=363754 RepID=N6U2H9_9HYPH|nr:winged helix-turn-helix domain-containing protein [Rhizobium freirei]ENN84543.1 transcriptional regulator, ArsR family [Rhizobium freirei PRF 81]